MNSALMTIARAKMAETRGTAAQSGRAWVHAGDLPVKALAPVMTTGAHRPTAARRTIGWFLVRIGLRLALPRSFAASAR
jgi:hypothetical protein